MKQIVLSLSFFCILFITTQEVFSFDRNKNIIEDILIQTNNFRKSKGLSKLVMRNDLNAIARQHSVDMAKGKVGFGHTGFGERNAMAKKRIKQMHAFAENVAYGAASGKEVVNMWALALQKINMEGFFTRRFLQNKFLTKINKYH